MVSRLQSSILVKQALDGQLFRTQYGRTCIISRPIQTMLSALVGCKHSTMKRILPDDINIHGIQYTAKASLIKNPEKVQEIHILTKINTKASDNQIDQLFAETARKSVVASIFADANIQIIHEWKRSL